MKRKLSIAAFLAVLLLASLACQTGQIMTPEEATQVAVATRAAELAGAGVAIEAEYGPGDAVELIGNSLLVPLFEAPGSADPAAQVARFDSATIVEAAEFQAEVWYLVETDDGEAGWVNASNLAATGEVTGGVQPQFGNGDTVYLQGVQFLIGIMSAPGSTNMIAGQERGAAVTILEARTVDGEVWYRVMAPTGEGWLPESNVTDQAPGS